MKIKTVKIKNEEFETIKVHPLLNKLKMTVSSDLKDTFAFYAEESKYFNHYERPVLTANNKVINNLAAWYSASTNGVAEIEVDIIEGLEEDDVLRFINAKSLFFKRNYPARYALISELRNHFETNPKGIEWVNSMEGDIIQKVSKITGYGESSTKMLAVIGKDDNDYFNQIKEGKLSLREAYNLIQAQGKAEPEQIQGQEGKEEDVLSGLRPSTSTPTPNVSSKGSKYKASDFIPMFAEGKSSIKAYGKVIQLNEQEVIEKSNSIVYHFTSSGGAVVEIIIKNLNIFKATA